MTDFISTLRMKTERYIYYYKKYGIMYSIKAIVHDVEALFLVGIFVKVILLPLRLVISNH